MVAEKGADLVKELWLQEITDNTIRYERDTTESKPSKKVDGKKASKKNIKAATSQKVNVFTNATAA